MANFTELNCFNKLLLQKMERLQKENNELKKRLDNATEHLEECEILRCKKCKFYFDNGDVDEVKKLNNDVNIYCYDNGCIHDVSWSCYKCESYYANGTHGMPQDWAKANELWLKAGELGCALAYYNLGNCYTNEGRGVEIDKKKAKHYYELAAMNGNVKARYKLGCMEGEAGNYQRACKHFMLAAKSGHEGSLEMVTKGFRSGYITKDEYESTLRAYHESQTEMKSEDRDKVAQTL